ncbi:MAG: Heme exporter protein C [Alphaproteobacteria bacterium MarineAlpha9_Bin5]|jgi:heme exporter protein C|nr:MAG: Heme exporter protein C [Alphaproteobacteria bacterium MarineAlpha9_Bin6]PPR39805.1 MAG: Heme exporter protein C [Alphaproteobacteria bacterium MarineAlpha9_Bin5]
MVNLHRFANPNRFMRLSGLILPWASVVAVLTFPVGLYLALINSPPDYEQRETVRIMYIHVPAAWMALFSYTCMAAASAVALIWRHPLADLAAKSIAPVGACFTLICLVTGSLWGQPTWGTWWVWDARLTSVLILFFLFVGYMVLFDAFDDPTKGARAAGILVIVGFVFVPIIKFSVDILELRTLHQGASVSKLSAPSVHESMLWPLLVMALAYAAYFISLLLVRMRSAILAARVRSLRMMQAQRASRAAIVPERP